MTESTTLAELKTSAIAAPISAEPMSFLTKGGFDQLLRVSNMLCSSSLVPVAYRKNKEIKEYGQIVGWEDNPAALANCAIALNMAHRMNADPILIMQNLHIIEGRPSWSSPFIIASINSCGRYHSLDYELSAPGEPVEIEYTAVEWINKKKTEVQKKVTVRHQTCKAFTTEKTTGKRLESPLISIQIALDEGWLTKKGSKWQTMPELMLRYRCASFFGRLYAPELLMGLQSTEEVEDFIQSTQDSPGSYSVNLQDLREAEVVDKSTGEITQAPKESKKDRIAREKAEALAEQAEKSESEEDQHPDQEVEHDPDVTPSRRDFGNIE